MPCTLRRPLLALTSAAMVAGCSSIGDVNGVPVNQGATLSSQSVQAGFCTRQPAVCILGGVLVVGAIAALASDGGGSSGSGSNPNRGGGID